MKKRYLIVGASSNIGVEIAETLLNEDADLILTGRDEGKLERFISGDHKGTVFLRCDVTDPESIGRLFSVIRDQALKLNGMVYCPGIALLNPVKTMSYGELENVFRVNVFGFSECLHYFQSTGISEKGASVVALSSYASISKEAGLSAYAMSKAAMNVQVEIAAKEFIRRGIRVNAVLPANVRSRMAAADNDWSEEELEEIKKIQPLGVIPIKEVADIVAFLLSDRARRITGELVTIGAGYKGK